MHVTPLASYGSPHMKDKTTLPGFRNDGNLLDLSKYSLDNINFLWAFTAG